MKPTVLLPREEVVSLIQRAFNRRMFVASDIKEYVSSLSPEKAFAASRLLPKEVLEKLLNHRDQTFADKIVDFHSEISKEGPLVEAVKTKLADEQFLVTHSVEFLRVMGDERY